MSIFESLILNVYIPTIHRLGFDQAAQVFTESRVARMVLIGKYKSLLPIETIEEERKKELWKYAKENFPDKSKDELIQIVKIVYTVWSLVPDLETV